MGVDRLPDDAEHHDGADRAPTGRPPGAPGTPLPDVLSMRARVVAGLVVAISYAASFVLRDAILPGIAGGALAGVLTYLVLREIDIRRRRRTR